MEVWREATAMENGLSVRVRAPFEKAVAFVTEALREQGFGVLTTIDVQETMLAKLRLPMERFVILGACNPSLAWRALDIDRRVGLMLPCNVVVRAADGDVVVEALAPQALVDVTGRAELEPLATDARQRLSAALHAVADVVR
jgi:uncharacterized protein (DUF302 family)